MAQKRKTNYDAYGENDDLAEEKLSVKQKENEQTEYQMLKYVLNASAILFKEI